MGKFVFQDIKSSCFKSMLSLTRGAFSEKTFWEEIKLENYSSKIMFILSRVEVPEIIRAEHRCFSFDVFLVLIQRIWKTSALISSVSELINSDFFLNQLCSELINSALFQRESALNKLSSALIFLALKH